jgi:hypothetical protein
MKKIAISFVLLIGFIFPMGISLAQPQPRLPVCIGDNPHEWNGCRGTYTYPNGNKYTGEYRNGMREGRGVIDVVAKGDPSNTRITSNIHSRYTGQFSNDRINGYGVWVADNGYRYEGYFIDNLPSNTPSNQNSGASSPPTGKVVLDAIGGFLQGLNRGVNNAANITRTNPSQTVVIQDGGTTQGRPVQIQGGSNFTPQMAPMPNNTSCDGVVRGNRASLSCN